MIAVLVGLILPIGAALAWLRVANPRRHAESALLALVLASCLGIAAASVFTFWWVEIGLAVDTRFAVADALLWLVLAAAAVVARRRSLLASPAPLASPTPFAPPASPASLASLWLVRAAFAAVAGIAVATAVAHYVAAPHGQWDAWAIWNQKARFIVRDVDHWTDMLAIGWSNPGHPFLVSLSVARLWAYAGSETTVVPALLGMVWAAAIVSVVIAALDVRSNRAWIAGALVLAPAVFTDLAAAQTADLAIALFVSVALVALLPVLAATTAGPVPDATQSRSVMLAGIIAGCAAWTKNEGMLFIAATTLLVAWTALRHRRPQHLGWWIAGLAPVLITVFWFKVVVAPVPPEYMSARQGEITVTAFLFDPARHAMIASLIASHGMAWGGPMAHGILPLTIAAGVAAAARRSGQSARVLLSVAAVMVLGYYAVWVVSPLDTTWLVNTTFDRLLMQVWPALVLAAFSGNNPMVPAAGPDPIS